ncbi:MULTISPECIES: hypothetical protein [Pseudomonas syringae group]|uniref:Uncharacterized protein n=4 Tax=Pseudomonas syringae group TaxID=136849 RepID=F3GGX9_PSESJ|nr:MULTISPECIES: hypothetical protein [Pseudomonas syringae group]EGH46329.1 hypothetical protein PSYPI_30096 [Pseudomonas syringae pv. pisi str. 1704B]RMU71311.1 hypothetical protein ALP24_102953 [Pseudomonas syringae pv. aptata]RML52878.1 hypothetical protein ALQ93_01830 [Pseudomonas syringae pv. pisi]RML64257.1 hypothetical protein ALQ92_102066 [Pseudomonas syringae pv. pisi]RMM27446.1 hypothetical protein ALQ82_03572 [Pseudomonas syringae pv. pisi]
MYSLIIHDDASGDLRQIIATNRSAGLKLVQVLGQLRVDQDALDRLSQVDWGGSPAWPKPRTAKFNTGPWGAAQKANMNLWRLRFFDDEILGYRIISAFFPRENQYQILAIVEKADFGAIHDERFNYELSHPISIRIASSYRELVNNFW